MSDNLWNALADEVQHVVAERITGRIERVTGTTIAAAGLPVPIGARCEIHVRGGQVLEAEVVGLQDRCAILSVFGEPTGIAPGNPVSCTGGVPRVPVGWDLLGRTIDAAGHPLDERPAPVLNLRYPLFRDAPEPFARRPIDAPLPLGVRAIDSMLTLGQGQRVGIFAGTGVGKSVLMGMICRNTQADVNVVALVGERGREVGEFLERDLGPEGRQRSVVLACTSDQPAAIRVRACFHAMAIAEYFRDQGANVLLVVDSLTRMAMAQRQIGLAAGEPPTARGYPPSAFALLPRLLERAGRTARGSITGLFTVLVEGDDIDDPLADAARGILDGHIWLSRRLANRGHYPAVDILNSISRVADQVVPPEQVAAARSLRQVLATWEDIEDLVSIGAYVPGANLDYDVAVAARDALTAFLRQDRGQQMPWAETCQTLAALQQTLVQVRGEAEQRAAGGGGAAIPGSS